MTSTVSSKPERRRPGTAQRTGRYRRLIAAGLESHSDSSFAASTRHTTIRHETTGDPIDLLNRLLKTLQEHDVPGPQLFRLNEEFTEQLGQGGQGNVRGLSPGYVKLYERTPKRIQRIWPAQHLAIKQHLERKSADSPRGVVRRDDLAARFRAAECEVLALAPGLFRDRPNIVNLVGWGLCLDTLEDPDSPCCAGLQLPLLVFERADMDLADFLNTLLPALLNRDGEGAEEGSSRLLRSPSSAGWWPFTRDPYEIVRELCIDVGHGLQDLHEHRFTHGDLKPENILVFKTPTGWTAKICDFGCAVGAVEGPDGTSSKHEERYLGTPGWLPSSCDRFNIKSFEALRQCDLYVYGLVVWSSFCLGGKHPPPYPRVEDAAHDFRRLWQAVGGWSCLPLSWGKPRALIQAERLLQSTMAPSGQRPLRPWVLLYRYPEWVYKTITGIETYAGCLVAGISTIGAYDPYDPSVTRLVTPQLTVSMKAEYNKMPWWTRSGADANGALPGEELGPASSVEFSNDQNCLSDALFENLGPTIPNLPSRMKQVLECEQAPCVSAQSEHLYHFARLRSRFTLRMWRQQQQALQEVAAGQDANILQLALTTQRPVHIHTLVWLCAGPVGRAEIKAISRGAPDVWEHICKRSPYQGGFIRSRRVLNASERLERFLLLLQFGCRVERQVWRHRSEYLSQSRPSIFARLVDSYSKNAQPAVVKEVYRRLCRACAESDLIHPKTVEYFVERLRDGTAVPERAQYGAEWIESTLRDLAKPQDYFDITMNYLDTSFQHLSRLATETDPLLSTPAYHLSNSFPPLPLPRGWQKVPAQPDATDEPSHCYEEAFTCSVTLVRPEVSLIEKRQVAVGLLEDDPGQLCRLDLQACMRAVWDPEEAVAERFPYYDDAWFTEECNMEPSAKENVLKKLLRPRRYVSYRRSSRGPVRTQGVLTSSHGPGSEYDDYED